MQSSKSLFLSLNRKVHLGTNYREASIFVFIDCCEWLFSWDVNCTHSLEGPRTSKIQCWSEECRSCLFHHRPQRPSRRQHSEARTWDVRAWRCKLNNKCWFHEEWNANNKINREKTILSFFVQDVYSQISPTEQDQRRPNCLKIANKK